MDIVDDADVQQIVKNYMVNTELGYLELFIETMCIRPMSGMRETLSQVLEAEEIGQSIDLGDIGTLGRVNSYIT